MSSDLITAVQAALATVNDPEIRRPITDLGMVKTIAEDGGRVQVDLWLTVAGCPMKDRLTNDIKAAVGAVAGVTGVDVVLDVMSDEQRQALKESLRGAAAGRTVPFTAPGNLTRVYAVASGKGGVGKSSITVNLAAAMAADGLSVGVLDADIYGFSVPRMLGVEQAPTKLDDMILPPVAHDVKVISIGMFVPGNQPVVWRGPMLHRALEQFLTDVHWGEPDYLLVDMPPGTGDIALTLSQKVPLTGAIIVTTPQDIALIDAKKALTMFKKVGVPILGIVENMAVHICTNCGHAEHIFGADGGRKMATEYEVDYLGALPLTMKIREQADSGRPSVAAEPESEIAALYKQVARTVAMKIAAKAKDFSSKFPTITVSKTT